MTSISKAHAERIAVTARRRSNMIANSLMRAKLTLEDLKTMRLEEIVDINGIGPETLMNLIIIKELLWKEGL